jgi:hypothetical protein
MTDTTPLITGVDFVCIPAQDFDAMTAFYGETLGLPFVKRYGSRPGAEYQAGNLTLATCAPQTSAGHSRATRCRSLCRSTTWPSRESGLRQRACASSATRLTPASAGRRSAWILTATRCRCTIATRRRTNAPPRRSQPRQQGLPGLHTFVSERNDAAASDESRQLAPGVPRAVRVAECPT